jgi:hypothetical protein
LEWETGVRDGHSDKLKASWDSRDRKAQGELFSLIKTKYKYRIQSLNFDETVLYTRLKELQLHGCVAKFAKHKTNVVEFKGYLIERLRVDSYRKDSDNQNLD